MSKVVIQKPVSIDTGDFANQVKLYDSLGKNLVQAFELLLNQHGIKYLSIYYRIKDLDSIREKIERKGYKNPFEDVEDLCGIRIICYFQSDIERVRDILTSALTISESNDKESALGFNQFGYRSHHIIATIDGSWTKVPNYADLANKKVEIQIRTILMHAWAEIEHNLAYKKTSHIPEHFRRKLHIISAKLEEADGQFEDLKNESEKYQKQLLQKGKVDDKLFEKEKFDLDTLQAFLDSIFPDKKKNIHTTSEFFDELIQYRISLKELKIAFKKVSPYLSQIEKDIYSISSFTSISQVGAARAVLDLTNLEYRKRRPRRKEKNALLIRWSRIVNSSTAKT